MLENVLGREGNPVGGLDARARSPELEKGKLTELRLELVAQFGRSREAIWKLAAVCLVDRTGRDHRVGRCVHGIPPARVRTGERRIDAPRRFPDFLSADELV